MSRAARVKPPVASAEDGLSPKWSLALAGLSAAQRKDIRSRMRTMTLPPRSILFRQGAPSDTMVVLEDGRVRLLQAQPSGEQFTFGVFVGGTILGLAALVLDRPRILTAEAIDQVVVSVMPRRDFVACTRSVPGFLDNITRLLALLSVESIERTGPQALDDAWVRLGSILTSLARNDSRNSCPTITGLTQEDLASMVGVSRSWIGAALAEFERMSLISKRRSRITIAQPARLAEFITAARRRRPDGSDCANSRHFRDEDRE
ncbi:Crp/Fnr family transcriptional regulator [Bradyrhizobium sp. Pha-3]|uniref:Crp/Fnr family transcriptional regulator n=1 Tax=Bradyrhizobium sp. Pha-3 TaxID=208375 RepID=UPI0035D40EF7